VLDLVRRTDSTANIEIKNIPTDPDFDSTDAYARTVCDAIKRSGVALKRVIIQSFWPANLDVAKQRLPRAETSLLTVAALNDFGIDQAQRSGYDWVSPAWPVSQDYVSRAHSAGLRVVPYTLDVGREMRAAIGVGVDALITNDPLRARRILAAS
jgi:glycerophosphoryl diester phosphodiesterase